MNLLTIDDIALMLQVSKPVAYGILRKPDFPRPTLNLSKKIRRWDTESVMGWLEKNRQRNAR